MTYPTVSTNIAYSTQTTIRQHTEFLIIITQIMQNHEQNPIYKYRNAVQWGGYRQSVYFPQGLESEV